MKLSAWIGSLVAVGIGVACGSSEDLPVEDQPMGVTPEDEGGAPPPAFGEGGGGGCEGGKKTSVSGVVYDPAGKVPLYNVVVYVPRGAVGPLPAGIACTQCGSQLAGESQVATLTDTKGHFVLEGVPADAPIPLVIQVGKWRRQVTLPAAKACVDNPIGDKELTRLPRKSAEGDMPRMALATGAADPLECLLRKIGIDDSEFTTSSGTGRVHLYRGAGGGSRFSTTLNGGAAYPVVSTFWADAAALASYDAVFHSCEGDDDDKPTPAKTALFAYTKAGGRAFLSHWAQQFVRGGGFPALASWVNGDDIGTTEATVDATFPKGKALAEWLVDVGASPAPGKLPLTDAQRTIAAVTPGLVRSWVTVPPSSVQIMSFNTPTDAAPEAQCGKVVVTDIHVSAGSTAGRPFPEGCPAGDLTPQEKALEFMLFDLGACIQNESLPPSPPK